MYQVVFDSITSKLGSLKDNVTQLVTHGDDDADTAKDGNTAGLWEGVDHNKRHKLDSAVAASMHKALGQDPEDLVDGVGMAGQIFIRLVDRAASIQSSTVQSYVDWLRAKYPHDDPAAIQGRLDKHFTLLSSGSGGAAGLASAIPGVGLVTGSLAIGTESLVFIDAAALYTLASGYLRGAKIDDPQRRRTLILVTILGSQGSAIVDAAVGSLGDEGSSSRSRTPIGLIAQAAPASIASINSRLTKLAMKTFTKKLAPAWVGKLLPFGIGAVIGWATSRKLARKVIKHAHTALGSLPSAFATPASAQVDKPKIIDAIERSEKSER